MHQPTEAHRQVHWQQQQQLWSQQMHQQQHPIVSHQNVQEIWQDTSPRFSQVWHPAHQQATSTIPIASHHQLITTPTQAVTVDQSHTRNQFFEPHQESHSQLHVGIPGQSDLNRDQHPQLTRDHAQPIGRTSPNMQFYQPQQTNHHQRLEYWQQQQQQFQDQTQHHSPNPEQRLHSPALQTSKAPESSTPSSQFMWQSPQVTEQRQQSPVPHHQTPSAQVNVEHRQPSQEAPSSVPSTQPVLVPHPGWQQLTPTNIPQLQLLQQMQQGQGQQQNQQEIMQQQLMFIQLQQMYHQQMIATQLAAHQLQQQQQQQQSHVTPERNEDKSSHFQPPDKQTPQHHQPLFGQFNKPPVSLPDVKPETSTNLPEKSIQRSVESNQFALNNPQHSSDPFKQHRTVTDSVPKAHVLPMKPEPKVTEVANAQPSTVTETATLLKAEPVLPVSSTPEKIQQPSPKRQNVQEDPLKPYESVFQKREQQFQANQAQKQRAAQISFPKPQSAPGAVPGPLYPRPLNRNDNRSNFPTTPHQLQQGAWKASFAGSLNQAPPLPGQKPGLPPRPDYKPPSWQDRKRFGDAPNVPVSQQVPPQRQQNTSASPGAPPLPQRQPRQSKQPPAKDNKENKENKPNWYNPYSGYQQDSNVKGGSEKTDASGKPKTGVKSESKDSSKAPDATESGVRALKGRLPGSYPGEGLEPTAPSASLVFGRDEKGNVNLSGPVFNPHPSDMPYYKEPSAPGGYPYPDGQRPKSEPLLRRALSEEKAEQKRKGKDKKMVGDGRCRLLVKNLNPVTSPESLQNYFEVMSKADVDDQILFTTDHTQALVTMEKKPDLTQLKKVLKDRKLEDRNLSVHEIQKIKSIIISSEKELDKTDAVLFYFERSQVGGALASDFVKKMDEGFIILEFEDENSVVKACQPGKTHTVEGKTLKVSPYYSCDEGAIWDTGLHLFPLPKPVSITLEPYQIDFLKKDLKPDLNAKVTFSGADNSVTFSCELKPTDKNYNALARQWESCVRDRVMKTLVENIDCMETEVPSDVWNRFLDWTAKFASGKVQVKKDAKKKCIKFISHPKVLRDLQPQIDQQIAELQRVARRKSEMKRINSVDKIKILETQGTFEEICNKFSDMVIQVKGNDVTVEGNPADISSAFVQIFEECESIQPGKFKHYKSQEFVNFVNSKSTKKFIQDNLDKKQFKGRWEVNSSEIVVFVTDGADPSNICKEIVNLVSEKRIPIALDLIDIVKSRDWKTFTNGIKTKSKDKIDIVTTDKPEVIILGIQEIKGIVKDVTSWIDDRTVKESFIKCDPLNIEFVCKCWKEDDFNDIESTGVKLSINENGILISGNSKQIRAAEDELEKRLKQICKAVKKLEKTAVCDVIHSAKMKGTLAEIEDKARCLIKLPGDMDGDSSFVMIDRNQTEEIKMNERGDSGKESFAGVITKKNNIKIHLVKGEIGQQKGDTLVCSTSSKLSLNSGAAHSLIKHGGQQLQNECKQKYPEGIQNGELAVIDGGKLKCERVYLTALPEWKDAKGGKILKDFLANCLRQSEQRQKRSIVINAMGTGGYLRYPKDVVAKLMYKAVADFDARQPRTWLKEVTFCVYSQDKDTVRAFEEQEHSQLMTASSGPVALPQDFKKGDVTIKVVTEDLATQQVDAVLCGVSEDMNLSHTGLCQTLLKQGGKGLQDECASRHNNKLPAGQVVDIGPGKLPCKVVLLANLPKYTAESTKETLLEVLNSAFLKASTKSCKSIAIPAMGTGHLNYPATTVAKCMYDAVVNWEKNKPKTQLKTFKFVLYSKNTEVMQAFQSCQRKMQGREERASRSFEGEGPKQSKESKYQLHGNTCTIGAVKLEVYVGDVLGEKTDAIVNGVNSNCELQGAIASALQTRCPNLNKEFNKRVNALKRDGVASTGANGLATKHIIHVQFQSTQTDWTSKMVTCLREADCLKAKSVAFPVLGAGTGSKSFQPDVIAECLFDAIDQYGSKHPKSALKDIRLIVYYQNAQDKPRIMTALKNKVNAGNNQSAARKFVRQVGDAVSDKMAQWGMMRHRGLRSVHEKRQVMVDMSSIELEIVSDSYANIDRCMVLLKGEIDRAYITSPVPIDQDLAKSLSESQLEEMVDPSILVDVKIDKRGAIIIVSGIGKNVLAAQDAIHKRCRDYEKEKNAKIEADILYNQIRWHFEEITATEVQEIEYGKNSNLKIETAYKGNKDTVELRDTEGKVYVIDFKELVEYPKDDKLDKVRVIRKDILKGARLSLPAIWAPMKQDEDFRVVYIDNKTPEFKEIEKEFITQVNSGPHANKIPNKQNIKVVKIERIQNRTLYEQYEAKKKNMKSQKHRKNKLERIVWHGTDCNAIASIERNGFNRSYCGLHGTWFGEGVYFAGDASYSAQAYLTGAQPGRTSNRYMFYVKALTGELIQGQKGMRVLPPVNPSGDKTVVYDCAVDDVKNPMEFVIFHDTQAYPEYVITYVG